MTQTEFLLLCTEHNLSPEMALENENVVEALKNRDDKLVAQILTNEF
jgi:hypothetical protein